MRTVNFWEDDYCQIELIPRENLDFVKEEINKINEFSNAHRAKDGLGWTSVYSRKENPAGLIHEEIMLSEIIKLFKDYKPFEGISYENNIVNTENETTLAYGENSNSVLFIEFDKEKLIKNIWLNLSISTEAEKRIILDLLTLLSTEYGLLLVDWGWGFYESIRNIQEIEEYLEKKIKVFGTALSQAVKKKKWWEFWK